MGSTDTPPESATAHTVDAGKAVRTETRQGAIGPDRRTDGGESTAGRGQTTLDFAVGFGIFLTSLAFIMLFVPGMLQPFVGGTQDETPAANRVADDLSKRLLGNVSEPYALDNQCTKQFFDSGSGTGCEFDGATLQEQVGVIDRMNVNVTISGNVSQSTTSEILCWDDDDGELVNRDDSDCDVLLTRGGKPSGSGGKTVSARRVAYLDGHDVTIEVVMW